MSDAIVIGAGSAGIPLASRLAHGGLSVTIVEAGPDYPSLDDLPVGLKHGFAEGTGLTADTTHLWGYTAKPNAVRDEMVLPRGKVTGGTSAINGQIFLRAPREEYDSWAARGIDGWAYEELLPYFRRIEADSDFGDSEVHGADGPIAVHRFALADWQPMQRAFYDACLAEGFPRCDDANAPGTWGVGPYPLNNPGTVRHSTALTYLPALREREDVEIRADTLVTRLLTDHDRVVGVEVEADGATTVLEGEEVFVCAGAIGTPHLLLRSGIGPSADLEATGVAVVRDLLGVGRNLQDHPLAPVVLQIKPERVVREPGLPYVQTVLRYTSDGGEFNDMLLLAYNNVEQLLLLPGVYGTAGCGRVRLTSTDPHVQPQIELEYLSHSDDRRRMRDAVRLAVRLGDRPEIRELVATRMSPTDEDLACDDRLDAWLDQMVQTSHHLSSTCRMGSADDAAAVVDPSGLVRGFANLRVADTSILPTSPRANTNCTAIVVGERIADLFLARRPAHSARAAS